MPNLQTNTQIYIGKKLDEMIHAHAVVERSIRIVVYAKNRKNV